MLNTVDLTTQLDEILSRFDGIEGALLPIFHAVQDAFGHIPQPALAQIAAHQTLTEAEVYGVMSFYHDFRARPAGEHVIKLCRAESCKAMGSDRLADCVKANLGVDWHETTPDGRVTLEPIFCLGLCACGPAALIDGAVVARLDETKLTTLIAEMRS